MMKKWLKIIIEILVFVVSIGLIIYGQKHIGVKEIGLMMLGVLGILGLLFVYNSKYKEKKPDKSKGAESE